jgi:predicted trehalose synthase
MSASGTPSNLPGAAVEALRDFVSSCISRRSGLEEAGGVDLIDVEVLTEGRPGIVDLIADAAGHILHIPVGLRSPGNEARLLPEAEDPVLGLLEDEQGTAVVTEAMRDAELATLLLHAVTGQSTDPALVRQIHIDDKAVTLAMEDRLAFTVFTELTPGQRPGIELLVELDRVGFNHIAAPVALWRRGGRDLGIVQEYLPGASTGWALALTSVRDLYALGGPPEIAGGDFAAEARRLGVMTARMHLSLYEAFGGRVADVELWARALEAAVRPVAPSLLDRPEVVDLLLALRTTRQPCYGIRTHGDFHLARVYRTELGWYVGDVGPGGRPHTVAGTVNEESTSEEAGNGRTDPSSDAAASDAGDKLPGDDGPRPARTRLPVFRSPLADVADMLWSFGLVARTAAVERDPTGREGLGELADAWEQRNRWSFLSGYLGVPEITEIVPSEEEDVRVLVAAFELERTAARVARLAGR